MTKKPDFAFLVDLAKKTIISLLMYPGCSKIRGRLALLLSVMKELEALEAKERSSINSGIFIQLLLSLSQVLISFVTSKQN